jgi:hypothetical protein
MLVVSLPNSHIHRIITAGVGILSIGLWASPDCCILSLSTRPDHGGSSESRTGSLYDKENWRVKHANVYRYLSASAHNMDSQFLAMSGPDNTKIGTDLNLTMSALMNSSSKVVALGAPQVRCRGLRVGKGQVMGPG